MYHKISISLIIIFSLINMLFSQNLNKIEANKDEDIKEKLSILKFEPVQLMDPLNTIYFSIEKQANAHTSFQAGLGYIIDDYINLNENIKLDKGAANFKLKAEYRIYCKNLVKRRTIWFFAPQLFYKEAIFNGECTELFQNEHNNGIINYIDKYKIQLQEFGIYTKTGLQRISNKGFVFEFYFGPGIKYVNTKTIDKISANNTTFIYNIFEATNEGNENKDRIIGCFTIGVSFGKCISNISRK